MRKWSPEPRWTAVLRNLRNGQRYCATTPSAARYRAVLRAPQQFPYPPTYAPHGLPNPVPIASVEPENIAPLGRRFAARLIDIALIWLAYLVLYFPFRETFAAVTFLVLPFWLLLWLLYEWLFVSSMGATIGKKALGVVVVDERTGALLGLTPAFVRAVLPVVGAVPADIGTGLIYVSTFFDRSGRVQGWHDKAAHDLVVLKAETIARARTSRPVS